MLRHSGESWWFLVEKSWLCWWHLVLHRPGLARSPENPNVEGAAEEWAACLEPATQHSPGKGLQMLQRGRSGDGTSMGTTHCPWLLL